MGGQAECEDARLRLRVGNVCHAAQGADTNAPNGLRPHQLVTVMGTLLVLQGRDSVVHTRTLRIRKLLDLTSRRPGKLNPVCEIGEKLLEAHARAVISSRGLAVRREFLRHLEVLGERYFVVGGAEAEDWVHLARLHPRR